MGALPIDMTTWAKRSGGPRSRGVARRCSFAALAVVFAACGGDDGVAMAPTQPTGVAGSAGSTLGLGAGGAAGAVGASGAAGFAMPVGTAGRGPQGQAGSPSGAGGFGFGRGMGRMNGAAGTASMPVAPGGVAGMAAPAVPSAGGSAPPTGTVDLSMCPAPPADAPPKAAEAWMVVNTLRLAAGAGCMNLVPALNASAQAHCDYMAMNRGNRMCTADPHGEVMSCAGFTGANVQAREVAAGYPRNLAYTEVLTTFGNNPVAAVPNWIDTVWHRIPLLDPWTADMGYGGAMGCDVIDLGRGMSTMPANTVVVYPYDGQTNVPPAFSGLEGPQPPPPPSGWPSAYPVNVYAQKISVTEHVITKDGDPTPLEHLWLDSKAPEVGSLRSYFGNTVFMYGAPFEVNTKYRVKIVGTYAGGALNLEWTFTTASRRPFGT